MLEVGRGGIPEIFSKIELLSLDVMGRESRAWRTQMIQCFVVWMTG